MDIQAVLSGIMLGVVVLIWISGRARTQAFLMLVFGAISSVRLELHGMHYLAVIVGFWSVLAALLRMFHLPLTGLGNARVRSGIRGLVAALLVAAWTGAIIWLLKGLPEPASPAEATAASASNLAGEHAPVWMAMVFTLFAVGFFAASLVVRKPGGDR